MNEHRYVMEQHIGRKLLRNEIVHHINGDKSDNRISNLQIMDLREHGRHHFTGTHIPSDRKEHLRDYKRQHCFDSHTKITKEILAQIRLLLGTMSQREIARRMGLSASAVHRIAKGRTFNYV